MPFRLAEIADLIGGKVDGDDSIVIDGLAKIEDAQSGQITFIANPKYAKYIDHTHASAVLVDLEFRACDKTLVRVKDPYFAFLTLLEHFHKESLPVEKGVHPSAVICEGAELGKDVSIAPFVYVGRNCVIGNGTQLHPGVVLEDGVHIGEACTLYSNVSIREGCKIENNVIIQMGAVIGSDGFGFAFHNGKYHKIPQTGIVVIKDDVEIGANTTIDRATMGETVIHRGTKIDNLCQIAHNVIVGEHTVIAAQAGISGSTKIGNNVKLGGQVGLVGHIEIGDNSIVGAQSGVMTSVKPGEFVFGTPSKGHIKTKREEVSLAKLPDLMKRFKALEKQVIELRQKLEEK